MASASQTLGLMKLALTKGVNKSWFLLSSWPSIPLKCY
jgi:hypothetical protein